MLKSEQEHKFNVYTVRAGNKYEFKVSYTGEILEQDKVPDFLRGITSINPDTLIGKGEVVHIIQLGYWRTKYYEPVVKKHV
jgi:hypothetical protein